jgi:UDP-GlcNAc:undecaprenyl-phosphate GlcNAc-1-phosphate transferase
VDRPQGYKGHLAATPYLGGAAVLCSVLVTGLLAASPDRVIIAVLGSAAALAVVGTIDDRIAVAPRWRVAIELAVAGLLFSVGVHWSPFGDGPLDFLLSAVWVVGIVNAFNLMDNIDGATATVTGVSSAALGVIALSADQPGIAIVAFALTGSCVGFLPHNLAGPARIFLGDGGSMPLGFIVAALSMAVFDRGPLGVSAILGGVLVAGLPILDTTLVVVSRHRRGVPFVTGGRDHLTHRLLPRAGSARRVAALLAAGQGVLTGLAIVSFQLGPEFAAPAALIVMVAGIGAVGLLDSAAWRPNCDFERERSLQARRRRASPGAAAPLRLIAEVRRVRPPETAPVPTVERLGRPSRRRAPRAVDPS